MTGTGPHQTEERLTLHSRLSDIARLPVWIESIASRYSIPGDTQYAMNLCLEEALANIIRHGYRCEADLPIRVCFTTPRPGHYLFTVEDDAPVFNPLDAPELAPLNPRDDMRIGGQGIRLLLRFADTLDYEPATTGNRLRIGFSVANSSMRTAESAESRKS